MSLATGFIQQGKCRHHSKKKESLGSHVKEMVSEAVAVEAGQE